MTQRELAAKTVRASFQHMSLSAVMCGAILVWYWLRGAPRFAVVTVVAIAGAAFGVATVLLAWGWMRWWRRADLTRAPR